MKKIKICFYPTCQKATNHFLANLAQILTNQGDFECFGFLDLVKQKLGKEFKQDVYHFNWFDQSMSFGSFLYRLYILLRIKLSGKRIVWTIHNSIPHGGVPFYNLFLRFFLLKFSSVIHIMCEGSRNLPYLKKYKKKLVLIPHGDYFNSYPKSDLDICKKYDIADNVPIVLFLGAIKPYKNIEVLLESFDFDNAILLICGKVFSREYLNKLTQKINNKKNIRFLPSFIPDSEISAYIQKASFLVTPYSYESVLNSGTILLACSYGKTVVCPDILSVCDIQKEEDCLITYHYDNEIEHINNLKNALNKAFDYVKTGTITSLETKAYRYMQKNSWQANSFKWSSLYK